MLAFYLHPTTIWDRLLLILVVATIILLLIALGLVMIALIFRRANANKAERWEKLEELWGPLLLSALAEDVTATQVYQHVLPKDSLFFIDYLLRYARRFQGKENQMLHKLAVPYIHLVAQELKSRYDTRRARAAYTLGVLDYETFYDKLITCLDDESPLVAMSAVRSLLRPGNGDAVEAVSKHLDRFADWHPNALSNLLAAVGRNAIPHLRARLVNNESKSEKEEAILVKALNTLGDPEIASWAVKRLGTASSIDLQASLLQLLKKVGDASSAEVIIPLCDSPYVAVRAQAVAALGELGETKHLTILRDRLDDTSSWVALHAAQALRRMGDNNWLKELSESDKPRAVLAMEVLGTPA